MLALYNIIQMSNKLIIMSKVRSIIRLYTEGVSKQSIGERTGLPRNSVKKYIRLFLASGKSLEVIEYMSDTELEQMFMDMVPAAILRMIHVIKHWKLFTRLWKKHSRAVEKPRRCFGSNICCSIRMATGYLSLSTIISYGRRHVTRLCILSIRPVKRCMWIMREKSLRFWILFY